MYKIIFAKAFYVISVQCIMNITQSQSGRAGFYVLKFKKNFV